MALADQTNVSPRALAETVVDAVVLVVRAFMGSLLGISTAAVFGVFALVGLAGLSFDTAVVSVAIAMNAMLLSLVVLGNLGGRDDE